MSECLVSLLFPFVLFPFACAGHQDQKSNCKAMYEKVGKGFDLNFARLDVPRQLRTLQDDAIRDKLSYGEFLKLARTRGFENYEIQKATEKEYLASALDSECGDPIITEQNSYDELRGLPCSSTVMSWKNGAIDRNSNCSNVVPVRRKVEKPKVSTKGSGSGASGL